MTKQADEVVYREDCDRLLTLLDKYGGHTDDCNITSFRMEADYHDGSESEPDCTCGYDAAMGERDD